MTLEPPNGPTAYRPSMVRVILAWGVHLYTGLGLVFAALMAYHLVKARPGDFEAVFLLMFIAVIVDATDGVLARAVRVKQVLPQFDGTLLDNLIDFLTYTFLPLMLLWRAGVVSDELAWNLIPPLMASGYGFCQTDAKTPDGFFRGFPSYWNIVAFYFYLLQPPVVVTIASLWLLAFLTFVPSLYLYPSRGKSVIDVLTNVLGALWAIALVWILVELLRGRNPQTDEGLRTIVLASLAYPVFYLTASWAITVRRFLARREPIEIADGSRLAETMKEKTRT